MKKSEIENERKIIERKKISERKEKKKREISGKKIFLSFTLITMTNSNYLFYSRMNEIYKKSFIITI